MSSHRRREHAATTQGSRRVSIPSHPSLFSSNFPILVNFLKCGCGISDNIIKLTNDSNCISDVSLKLDEVPREDGDREMAQQLEQLSGSDKTHERKRMQPLLCH